MNHENNDSDVHQTMVSNYHYHTAPDAVKTNLNDLRDLSLYVQFITKRIYSLKDVFSCLVSKLHAKCKLLPHKIIFEQLQKNISLSSIINKQQNKKLWKIWSTNMQKNFHETWLSEMDQQTKRCTNYENMENKTKDYVKLKN